MWAWLNKIPQMLGVRWDDKGIAGAWFWSRQGFHFAGGVIIGIVSLLVSLIPGAKPYTYAVSGSLLSGIIIWKELSEEPRQKWYKTVLDITFWGAGFLLVLFLDIIFIP